MKSFESFPTDCSNNVPLSILKYSGMQSTCTVTQCIVHPNGWEEYQHAIEKTEVTALFVYKHYQRFLRSDNKLECLAV